ncbi:acyl carrier protein [Sphaerisporangium corydalis]|uniref:Acyl carrier protein n=1 Tax=Sphaerisporangium corydalis TaxID=1441875 RepID=A0ABV9EPM5_9ACTN|nr:acyl carrier protein [Sphaerisporangium corydalis]
MTEDELCQIIAGVLPGKDVAPHMSLRNDLGVDSIGLMSIVFVLEEQTGIDTTSHVMEFIEAEYVHDIVGICLKAGS